MAVETMTPNGTLIDTAASRLSWPSIFGGTFVALGTWVLLAAFGLAIGLTAVTPADPSLKGVALWLGVWSLVVPIIAMAAGSLVAAKTAGAVRTFTGMMYGAVVWGLTTLATTLLLISFTGALVGRTLGVVSSVASTAASTAASVAGSAAGAGEGGGAAQSIASFLGLDRGDAIAAANQRLQAAGKPPVSPAALQAAMRDAANTAIRQGTMNEEVLVNALVQHTRLSADDVRDLAASLRQQWDQVAAPAGQRLQQAATTARNAALGAVNTLGKAFWVLFGSVLLGLAASLAAGWAGTRRQDVIEAIPMAPAPAPLRTREAGV